MPERSGLRVLVTGGAGYLGSILCERLLDAGHRVTVVDNLSHGSAPLFQLCSDPGFDFVQGDVRDEQLMASLVRAADVLVPLAAIVGAPACARDPWLAESVNLGAVRLLNRLRDRSQLVVFPNSNSGYGSRPGSEPCTEETPFRPISLYGRTKCEAERELLDRGNAISLRLATVFGMSPRLRLDLLVNDFVHTAFTQATLVVFEKDFRRNFIHVRDVADSFLHSIEHADRMAGRAFNAGLDDANLTKGELARKIQEHVPGLYVHYAEVGSDPDRRDYVVSSARLRESGFVAARSLDDGIRELLKGFRMLGVPRWRNA